MAFLVQLHPKPIGKRPVEVRGKHPSPIPYLCYHRCLYGLVQCQLFCAGLSSAVESQHCSLSKEKMCMFPFTARAACCLWGMAGGFQDLPQTAAEEPVSALIANVRLLKGEEVAVSTL